MTGKALSTILEVCRIGALKNERKIRQYLLEWLFIITLTTPDDEFTQIGV
jgi:hypothetical protein